MHRRVGAEQDRLLTGLRNVSATMSDGMILHIQEQRMKRATYTEWPIPIVSGYPNEEYAVDRRTYYALNKDGICDLVCLLEHRLFFK